MRSEQNLGWQSHGNWTGPRRSISFPSYPNSSVTVQFFKTLTWSDEGQRASTSRLSSYAGCLD
jgi:hypothetical protein